MKNIDKKLNLITAKKVEINLHILLSDRTNDAVKELVSNTLRKFGEDPGFMGSHYNIKIMKNV